MSKLFVHGLGAVSPAGWGVPVLTEVLKRGRPVPTEHLARPGWEKPLRIRPVPPPPARPAFLNHPRLRRAGMITQHVVAAALEALGGDAEGVQSGKLRLGLILCVMNGSVTYSRRFFEEVLRDPAMASPLIFPESVFNAPASHLAAYLNSATVSYTLVGDEGTFLQGMALASDWLQRGHADGCIVVGAEEMDWIIADAVRLFRRGTIYSGGAGAFYLKNSPAAAAPVEVVAVTDSFSFTRKQDRIDATLKMKAQLPVGVAGELLCHNENGNVNGQFCAGHCLAPKQVLGEAFVASAAWQCVAACDLIRKKEYAAANVYVVGANQQAIGTRFVGNGLWTNV